MKKIFILYQLVDKTVCVPSTDYYARSGDWQTEDLEVLSYIDKYESEEAAIADLVEILKDSTKNKYTILPIYTCN